jgi:hypothetical protein
VADDAATRTTPRAARFPLRCTTFPRFAGAANLLPSATPVRLISSFARLAQLLCLMGFERKSVPRYLGCGNGRDTFCMDSYKSVDVWDHRGEAFYKKGLRNNVARVDYRSGCARSDDIHPPLNSIRSPSFRRAYTIILRVSCGTRRIRTRAHRTKRA